MSYKECFHSSFVSQTTRQLFMTIHIYKSQICIYVQVNVFVCIQMYTCIYVCMYLTYFTYYGLFIYFLWNECHYASDIVIRSLLCVCTHVFLHRRNNGPILNNSFFWSCGSCYFHDFYGSEIQKELSWMNFIVVCHWILVRC